KASGMVKRVVGGVVTATVLDLPVNSSSERGLLGIALDPGFPATPNVYLFWTESSTGVDSSALAEAVLLGNRVDRFTWEPLAQTLTHAANLIRLRSLQNDNNSALAPATPTPRGNHNGGKIAMGPDGKLHVMIGDTGRRGWMQNLADGPFNPATGFDDQFGGPAPDNSHLTGAILRLNLDGSAPADNPFFGAGAAIGGEVGANIQRVYSYGHRNGFGLAFDPVSGNLWESENGDDAFDEINKVVPGGNYGWTQVMGPLGRIAQFKTIETNLFTPAAAPIGAIQQLRFPVTRVAYTPAVVTSRLFMLPGATYQDPELSWRYAVPPSGLGFVNGNGLGAGYNGTLWSGMAQADDVTAGSTGTFAGGALMVMRLTGDRQHLDLSADPRLADRVVDNGSTYPPPFGTPANTAGYKFDGRESESLLIGQGFGITTDIRMGPDGCLYTVSFTDSAVYKICAAPPVAPARAR
ncbi:MAG: PQQ-dependent sugar dehydrogenase, partial [Burkholderiales bacterium]|nr:PQQ-dependent sugar dehydrogenase [Burkholderiales bacterium]